MNTITVVMTNLHGCNAVALARESMLRDNPGLLFYGQDNGSSDGAAQYMKETFDYYEQVPFPGQYHGVVLDKLCKMVTTEFTLALDNDTESRGLHLSDLLRFMEQTGAECVTPYHTEPYGSYTMNSYDGTPIPMVTQERIDPAFALWRTSTLQKLLSITSWARYISIDNQEWYDAGGMLAKVAKGCGIKYCYHLDIWKNFKHYGELSALWTGWDGQIRNDADPVWQAKKEILQARYAEITERLKLLHRDRGDEIASTIGH